MQNYPTKKTPLAAPVLHEIRDRWSPMAFSPTPLSSEEIASLFEAARWAPSAFGEQPWRYIYAGKSDDGRDDLEGLLVEGNSWAKNAGLLVLGFAKTVFDRNEKPNRHALYDTGCATGFLTLQATNMGLISHQMAGYNAGQANEVLGVPKEYEPAAMIAIGQAGDVSQLSDDLKKRQDAPRNRLPAEHIAMPGHFTA